MKKVLSGVSSDVFNYFVGKIIGESKFEGYKIEEGELVELRHYNKKDDFIISFYYKLRWDEEKEICVYDIFEKMEGEEC